MSIAPSCPTVAPEIFATLYRNLGIDLNPIREFDSSGRPQHPVEPNTEAVRELV